MKARRITLIPGWEDAYQSARNGYTIAGITERLEALERIRQSHTSSRKRISPAHLHVLVRQEAGEPFPHLLIVNGEPVHIEIPLTGGADQ